MMVGRVRLTGEREGVLHSAWASGKLVRPAKLRRPDKFDARMWGKPLSPLRTPLYSLYRSAATSVAVPSWIGNISGSVLMPVNDPFMVARGACCSPRWLPAACATSGFVPHSSHARLAWAQTLSHPTAHSDAMSSTTDRSRQQPGSWSALGVGCRPHRALATYQPAQISSTRLIQIMR